MSPPAENARVPAPVITMQPTSSSAFIRATASRSAALSSAFIALSCSGRFKVTIATPSVFSTRTTRSAMLALRRRLRRRGGSIHRRGRFRGLLQEPLAERAVGLRADHAVELRPVARDEADPLDRHVVDAAVAVA